MNTNQTTTKAPPGRPPVTINWPDGEFTVEQLVTSTKLSKVTLYAKIKTALSDQVIVVTGKENTRQGRPRVVYTKSVPTTETSNTTAQATIVTT